jgi:hypothetical protein
MLQECFYECMYSIYLEKCECVLTSVIYDMEQNYSRNCRNRTDGIYLDVCLMVINTTFNNISVISWWSVLLEGTGGPEKNTELSQVTDKLYHIKLYTSP